MDPDYQTLARRVSEIERQLTSPILGPAFRAAILTSIGIRYTETEPTHTPDKEVEVWVYFDATDYWLYVWANGGWRTIQLTA